MNIYIWYYVNELTERYHDGGGLNIVAPSLERARELWTEKYPDRTCKCLTVSPDWVLGLYDDTVDETVIIFPDAGCC